MLALQILRDALHTLIAAHPDIFVQLLQVILDYHVEMVHLLLLGHAFRLIAYRNAVHVLCQRENWIRCH